MWKFKIPMSCKFEVLSMKPVVTPLRLESVNFVPFTIHKTEDIPLPRHVKKTLSPTITTVSSESRHTDK